MTKEVGFEVAAGSEATEADWTLVRAFTGVGSQMDL